MPAGPDLGCIRHVCLLKVLAPENVEYRIAGGDQIVGDDPSVARSVGGIATTLPPRT